MRRRSSGRPGGPLSWGSSTLTIATQSARRGILDPSKSRARFTVKVQPRARQTALGEKLGDAYKLRLQAPPVDGKANEACIRFFAERFGVAVSAVRIVQGLASRTKVVEVTGADPAAVEHILGDER